MKKGCLIATLVPLILVGAAFVLFIAMSNRAGKEPVVFKPPPENLTVRKEFDKFSGLEMYTVGPLLAAYDAQTDEPLTMGFDLFFSEDKKKPFRASIVFTAKTVDVGEPRYRRGDLVYALADGERVISAPLQMLKDERSWTSIDRVQGFVVDTTPEVFEKLGQATKVEWKVATTEFTLKAEHQQALREMLKEAKRPNAIK
jgi:hypothetical protein